MPDKPKANMSQLREMFVITDDPEQGWNLWVIDANKSQEWKTVTIEWRDILVKNGMWMPETGDKHYYIDFDSVTYDAPWEGCEVDRSCQYMWNIFLKKEHAQLAIDYRKFLFKNTAKDGEGERFVYYANEWYQIATSVDYSWSDRISINSSQEVINKFIDFNQMLDATVRLYNCMR